MGPTEPVPPPAAASIYVDGREATERPTEGQVVFQVVGEDGAVRVTLLLAPGQPLPQYDIQVPDPVEAVAATEPEPVSVTEPVGPAEEPAETPTSGGKGLVVGAGASAVLAAGLYSTAYFALKGKNSNYPWTAEEDRENWCLESSSWYCSSADATEAQSRQRVTNGVVVASGVFGVAAIGLGATVVVKRF